MNFRSYNDLIHLVRRKMSSLPDDIDLVVHVPRSGIIPAAQIALHRNLPIVSLDEYLSGADDATRFSARKRRGGDGTGRVLVVDDSVGDGGALARVRAALAAHPDAGKRPVSFLAVYWSGVPVEGLDYWFEKVPRPRLFEWNALHHEGMSNFCVDIDGVLCRDPTRAENDDGDCYAAFLRDTDLIATPTHEIGWLISNRLEKYRPQTEDWLARHGIRYRELILLDGVSAETRRKAGAHGWFKGRTYRDLPAELFIESEPFQARDIAQIAVKPVLCTENWSLYRPDMNRLDQHATQARGLLRRAGRALRRKLGG
ncbi:phosphoribosyltransferase [Rhodovulum adriaticum]|uniref:Putative HAD superfamily protein n=1 Tax=Rhodovulum adriaticum TaxID=35804 RepID=A0A4R2NYD5_RHOAD|nr:phosphoribosyltransferase [Rhodovulum adriaticum]MBK1634219.1 hypothetical protein [Rhodovulum adriaticum]TCP27230.1 putative HAD superfamily protein [Rhodovulum adriaticum]